MFCIQAGGPVHPASTPRLCASPSHLAYAHLTRASHPRFTAYLAYTPHLESHLGHLGASPSHPHIHSHLHPQSPPDSKK